MTITTTSNEKARLHTAKLNWREQMRTHYGKAWTKKQRIINTPKHTELLAIPLLCNLCQNIIQHKNQITWYYKLN